MHIRMRNILRNLVVAGTLLALTLPALAQDPASPPSTPRAGRGGRGGRAGRNASLAAFPISLLNMITSLSADQRSKIMTIQEQVKTDLKTADRTSRVTVITKANDDVKAVLTPTQVEQVQKALPALSLINRSQAIPMGALDEVKLTKDQFTKIMDFAEATASQLTGLRGQERQTKMQEVGPQLKSQIEGVLTDAQKSAISKYEAAHPRRQRGATPGSPAANA